MSQHDHPSYKKIYITLLVLLAISVAGPFLGILWVTLITAFGIALVKASLVIQHFMHLKYEKRIMKWMLATSLALMLLFFAGVAPDIMQHSGHQWVNDAALAATARGIEAPHGEEVAHVEDEAEATSEVEPERVEQQTFDAKGAFTTVCATCHGVGGKGDGPGAAALDPKPADFSDASFWASADDAELIKVIREGGAAAGKSPLMPAWGALYSEAQAQAIVDYLKTLSNG